MTIDLDIIRASSLVVVPIIVALVQAIKMTGWVQDKYAPLVSIGIGILIGFFADHDTLDWSGMVLGGAIYGLMASGLYSGIKTTQYAIMKERMYGKKTNKQDDTCNK